MLSLPFLKHAAVFFLEHLFFQGREVVDEEYAVKMIDFMLKSDGKKPLGVVGHFLPIQIQGFYNNFGVAMDIGSIFGYGEASFLFV